MAKAAPRAIEGEINRLRSLAVEELRGEWRRLYSSEPPQISRDLLVLGLGYRLQEIDQGGLGKATRRKLRTIAKNLRKTDRVGPTPSLALKPGARLVREWGGRAHTVAVTEDGFEYAGTSRIGRVRVSLNYSRQIAQELRGVMAETHNTPRRSAKKVRCAIYTRKSTDEGLEQAFNSLDAQREACAAFIQSQRHEGWLVLPALYDDGGYSGGSLERPALKRLLADIEADQIDVVVVVQGRPAYASAF